MSGTALAEHRGVLTDQLASDDHAQLRGIVLGALGGALFAAGGPGGRRSGLLMRMAGVICMAAAATPVVAEQVRRAGERRRRVAVRSSFDIERPVVDVFAFFKDFENFPRVIGALRSVIDYQDGRSRWEMYSTAGSVVAWDAVVTKYVPNSVIAWESVPGSTVESAGLVRFTPRGPLATRVDLVLTHHPAHTGLNDAMRALVSAPAATRLQDALDRTPFYVESLPHEAPDESPLEPPDAHVYDSPAPVLSLVRRPH